MPLMNMAGMFGCAKRVIYRQRAILLGIVLYLLGASLHLGLLEYARAPFIFGDDGDAFFNMWVMDHSVRSIARGDLDLADGRIFWPENGRTFFWSDNLLVPAPFFAFLKTCTGNIMTAFWGACMLLSVLGYAAYFFLFHTIYRIARDRFPGLPVRSDLFVPVFAYMANFSMCRTVYFIHFQNLSCFWLFLIVAGGLGLRYGRGKSYFRLMVVSELALMYSAPYFAVLGAGFILAWAVFRLFLDPRDFVALLRGHIALLAVSIPVFGFMAAMYLQAGITPLSPSYVAGRSVEFKHLVMPPLGVARSVFRALSGEMPVTDHEKPAYLGAGVILALIAVSAWKAPSILRGLRMHVRTPSFWAISCLLLVCGIAGRKLPALGAWTGFAAVAGMLVLFVRGAARGQNRNAGVSVYAFPALCAILAYGLAFGPRSRFVGQAVNPSVWGVMAAFMPGIAHMRAIGRMAVVGQGLLMGCLLAALFKLLAGTRGRHRSALVGAALFMAAVQFTGQLGARAPMRRYDARAVTPADAEREFFEGLHGVAVVFPTVPFHRNSHAMLYFAGFPGITLMNGYSSRSTGLWDGLMNLDWGERQPTPAQISFAVRAGCDYIVLWKTRLGSIERIDAARESLSKVLFENDRFIVLPAGPYRES